METFLKEAVIDLILDSKNINNKTKVNLIRFVREQAEERHLEVILTDNDYLGLSTVLTEDLADSAIRSVQTAQNIEAGMLVGGAAAIAGLGILTAYKYYKQFLSKAARACSKFPEGSELKAKCMYRFKQEGMKKQIAILMQTKAKCKQSKNPQTCTAKIDKKIESIKQDLNRYPNR